MGLAKRSRGIRRMLPPLARCRARERRRVYAQPSAASRTRAIRTIRMPSDAERRIVGRAQGLHQRSLLQVQQLRCGLAPAQCYPCDWTGRRPSGTVLTQRGERAGPLEGEIVVTKAVLMWLAVVCAGGGGVGLGADEPPARVEVGESIDVRVVNLEAVVTDRQGHRGRGLGAGDVSVL